MLFYRGNWCDKTFIWTDFDRILRDYASMRAVFRMFCFRLLFVFGCFLFSDVLFSYFFVSGCFLFSDVLFSDAFCFRMFPFRMLFVFECFVFSDSFLDNDRWLCIFSIRNKNHNMNNVSGIKIVPSR